MSNNQLAGFPAFGPRVDTKITYHPKMYEPETALDLPTSEPTTAQVQFLLEAGDEPSYSPYQIPSAGTTFQARCGVHTLIGFQNTTGGALSVNLKYKSANTPTFTTTDVAGRSISANKYKIVLSDKTITNVALGDTHEFKCWANGAGVKLLWACMILVPIGGGSGLRGMGLADLVIEVSNTSFVSAANVLSTGYSLQVSILEPNGSTLTRSITANMDSPVFPVGSAGSLYSCVSTSTLWGNEGTVDLYSHYQPYYPTRIAYTPIL